jgi:hypothetical protein
MDDYSALLIVMLYGVVLGGLVLRIPSLLRRRLRTRGLGIVPHAQEEVRGNRERWERLLPLLFAPLGVYVCIGGLCLPQSAAIGRWMGGVVCVIILVAVLYIGRQDDQAQE